MAAVVLILAGIASWDGCGGAGHRGKAATVKPVAKQDDDSDLPPYAMGAALTMADGGNSIVLSETKLGSGPLAAFSANENAVLGFGREDNAVYRTGEKPKTLHGRFERRAALSADGSRAILVNSKGDVQLYDVKSRKVLRKWTPGIGVGEFDVGFVELNAARSGGKVIAPPSSAAKKPPPTDSKAIKPVVIPDGPIGVLHTGCRLLHLDPNVATPILVGTPRCEDKSRSSDGGADVRRISDKYFLVSDLAVKLSTSFGNIYRTASVVDMNTGAVVMHVDVDVDHPMEVPAASADGKSVWFQRDGDLFRAGSDGVIARVAKDVVGRTMIIDPTGAHAAFLLNGKDDGSGAELFVADVASKQVHSLGATAGTTGAYIVNGTVLAIPRPGKHGVDCFDMTSATKSVVLDGVAISYLIALPGSREFIVGHKWGEDDVNLTRTKWPEETVAPAAPADELIEPPTDGSDKPAKPAPVPPGMTVH